MKLSKLLSRTYDKNLKLKHSNIDRRRRLDAEDLLSDFLTFNFYFRPPNVGIIFWFRYVIISRRLINNPSVCLFSFCLGDNLFTKCINGYESLFQMQYMVYFYIDKEIIIAPEEDVFSDKYAEYSSEDWLREGNKECRVMVLYKDQQYEACVLQVRQCICCAKCYV